MLLNSSLLLLRSLLGLVRLVTWDTGMLFGRGGEGEAWVGPVDHLEGWLLGVNLIGPSKETANLVRGGQLDRREDGLCHYFKGVD